MKRSAKIGLALVAIMLLGASWLLTFGNAGWQIRRVFPGATPYFDPVMSPDITTSSLLRVAVPFYFGADESLGFTLTDQSTPIDLEAGFARLTHLQFFSIHIKRCKITRLCEVGRADRPGIVVFEDCDFSQLTPEQRTRLRPYDRQNPSDTRVCIGDV
ncbi:MAG: hypothetical protein JNM99_17110 [Verrucomicrobiaceae bacterium]|nr:hypothetical protein [Verrucomicrobiaceae bacterium]